VAQPDETRLHHDVSRAEQARAALDNWVLTEAFATLERSYVEAWRSTLVDDMAAREKLFLTVSIVGMVRDQLARLVCGRRTGQTVS
jgi:hypothetical protein